MQLVVLGMHRSGTSAVTGALSLMGAYFGPDDAGLPANEENPKGFWERRDFHRLCNDLMHSAEAEWWKVAEFSPDQIPQDALEAGLDAFGGILEELDEHRPWVLKEPQLCLLLPLFLPRLQQPTAVLVHRDPVEVALSLANRNGFPLELGVALWETYVRSALAASTDLPRVLVPYADLVADPVGAMNDLHKALSECGVDGLEVPPEAQAETFLSTDLHRHRASVQRRADHLNPAQLQLASALDEGLFTASLETAEVSAGAREVMALYERSNPEGPRRAGGPRPRVVNLERLVQENIALAGAQQREIRQHMERKSQLERQLAAAKKKQAATDLDVVEQRGRADTLALQLAQLREAYEWQETETNQLRARTAELEREVGEARAEIPKVRTLYRRAARRNQGLTHELGAAQIRQQKLELRIAKLQGRVRKLEKKHKALAARHRKLLRSPLVRPFMVARRITRSVFRRS